MPGFFVTSEPGILTRTRSDYPAEVIDTAGADDTFVTEFLSRLLENV